MAKSEHQHRKTETWTQYGIDQVALVLKNLPAALHCHSSSSGGDGHGRSEGQKRMTRAH
jgi:hypothetical protein